MPETVPVVTKLMIVGTRGLPIRGDVLSHAIKKEARRLGIAEPKPLPGLHKNAVMRLKEVGRTDEEIEAATGPSKEMIKNYGRAFNRRKLAEAAVIKMARKAEDNGP